jgi:hypothetical protein
VRCIIEYHEQLHPPLLRIYVHGAPHCRQHIAVIQQYRDELVDAARAVRLPFPIQHEIDLKVTFIISRLHRLVGLGGWGLYRSLGSPMPTA